MVSAASESSGKLTIMKGWAYGIFQEVPYDDYYQKIFSHFDLVRLRHDIQNPWLNLGNAQRPKNFDGLGTNNLVL